jgi:hypothetical protein
MLRISSVERKGGIRKVTIEFTEGDALKLSQSILFPIESLAYYRREVEAIKPTEGGEYIWRHVGMDGRLEIELRMNKDEYLRLLRCFDLIEKNAWEKGVLEYLEI